MATYFILGSLLIAMLPRTMAHSHSHPAQISSTTQAVAVTPKNPTAPQQVAAIGTTKSAVDSPTNSANPQPSPSTASTKTTAIAAQISDASSRPGAVTISTNAPTVAPMIVDAPLQGAITVIEPNGMFYISIGQREQLNQGALLLILRDDQVIGEARVLQVDLLDSLAVVKVGGQIFSILSGDRVMVKNNPYVAPNPRRKPRVQPNMSQLESDLMLSLLTILAVGATIAHN